MAPEQSSDNGGTELGRFLRARRSQVTPADVGFAPGTGVGRTPGLRREEVAALAGGTLTLGFQGMQLEETPGQRLGVYLAEPGTPDCDAMILLDMSAPAVAEGQSRNNGTVIPKERTTGETVLPGPARVITRTENPMSGVVPDVALNNGVEMPMLGFGVFQTPPEETRAAVEAALTAGYRHIDTAAAYGNEKQVGEALVNSGVPRPEVFIETKIWISDYGYDETLHSFDKSAGKLGLDQIDLLILHQALPSDFAKTVAAYRALETLLKDGKVRAIGVSNFMVEHLTRLLDSTTVMPAVNQIEVHPYFQQRGVQEFGHRHGILTQAWSPIGGITFYRDSKHTSTLEDPVILGIAKAHSKSPAQVMLRWHLQEGRSVIPKSTKPERIAENIDVFDFELTPDELTSIDALDTDQRGGPEPEAMTLARFGRPIPEA